MIVEVLTFMALRGVLSAAQIDLDKVNVLNAVTLGDLTGNWLASWGQHFGLKGINALERFAQNGGLPKNHDLGAAERRALATVMFAFHRALAARRDGMTVHENHWIDVLETLGDRLRTDNIDGEALYSRCQDRIQAQLESSGAEQPDFVRLARGESDAGMASLVHAGILEWMEDELRIKPVVARDTPEWVRGIGGHDPTKMSTMPQQTNDLIHDPQGFPIRPADPQSWWKFWRRPPVARPEIRMMFLNVWAQCYIEELKVTPRAFSAHLLAYLDDLRQGHPEHAKQLEAAKSAVDSTLAGMLRIENQLAELLGTTAENLRRIQHNVDGSHQLLTELIRRQAEDADAWQRVDKELAAIKEILHEEYSPPMDQSKDEPASVATGPKIEFPELVYRKRWMPDLLFREREMETLCGFLDSEGAFAIHVLTGDAGCGKSRIAMELVRRAQAEGWRAGFIQSGVRLKDLPQLHKWHPTRSTLLVIDYASEQGSSLAESLASLSLEKEVFAGKLRVLLIDRRGALEPLLNDLQTFADKGLDSNRDKVRRHLFAHLASADGRQAHRVYKEAEAALVVQSLDVQASGDFLRAVWARAGQPDHPLPAGWEQDVDRVTKGRPLLLTVLALHYLRMDGDASVPAEMDNLLDELIAGEVQHRWHRILKKQLHDHGHTEDLLARLQALVAVVTLCRGLTLTDHAVALQKRYGTGTAADQSLLEALKEVLGLSGDPQSPRRLRPLEPDLLAERFLLRGGWVPAPANEFALPAAPPFSLDGLVPDALGFDRDGVVATTALIANDYPEAFPRLLHTLLQSLPDHPGITDEHGSCLAYREVKHPIVALWRLSLIHVFSEVMKMATPLTVASSPSVLESLRNWAAQSPAARYGSAIGAVLNGEGIRLAFPVKVWNIWDVTVLGPLLDSCLYHSPDDCPPGGILTAIAAVNAVTEYGKAERWEDLERWGDRLVGFAGAHPESVEIQLELAYAAFNAVTLYSEAVRWEDLERWGDRLVGVAGAHQESVGIQLALASAAVNAEIQYGKAERWEDVERWGGRLVGVAGAHQESVEIQLELAKAAANAVRFYGKAERWEDLERWGGRLVGVAGAHQESVEIQLELAKAAFKAVNFYGEAKLWEDLERWGDRLVGFAGAHPESVEIQLELAKAAIHAVNFYGEAKLWEDLERWGDRLEAVAGKHPESVEIQLELAKAAFNALNDYGKAERWEDVERWGDRLVGVAGAHQESVKIQLELAKAAFNAVNFYGEAKLWENLERWSGRLVGVAGAHQESVGIQLVLAKAAVNAVTEYGKAERWEDVERWGGRLVGVAGAHQESVEIQLELAKAAVNAVTLYCKAERWEDLERWGGRLVGVAGAHQESVEIQLYLARAAVNAVNVYGKAERWEDQRRWANALHASLPARIASPEEGQTVKQIYGLLYTIQRRDQQSALQAVIDLIEQRYAAPPPPAAPELRLEALLRNWRALPEEVRAAVRAGLVAKGIDVDRLLEQMEQEERRGGDEP
jgi:hypothetical protein